MFGVDFVGSAQSSFGPDMRQIPFFDEAENAF